MSAKPERSGEALEELSVAASAAAEPVIEPHDDFPGLERADEDVLDEALASTLATAGVNGITTVVSIPVPAISSSRSSSVVIGIGARSGCSTSIG